MEHTLSIPWKLRTLQFVWFSTNPRSTADDLLELLTGLKSSFSTRASLPDGSSTVANALVDGVTHQVNINPGRLDYFVQPSVFDPAAALVDETLAAVVDKVSNASLTMVGLSRLSMVTTLQHELPTMREAFNSLSEVGHISLPFDDGSDLQFQVNRRRPIASVAGMQMNRLLRLQNWATRFMSGVPVGTLPIAEDGIDRLFLQMILDLNTVPSTDRIISSEQAPPVWRELLTETIRIRAVGELSSLAEP